MRTISADPDPTEPDKTDPFIISEQPSTYKTFKRRLARALSAPCGMPESSPLIRSEGTDTLAPSLVRNEASDNLAALDRQMFPESGTK